MMSCLMKMMEKHPIDGILLLNKPQGLSSNAVLQQVKRLFQAKKAGHTGSLDPLATGMLPICFGEATKVSQYLLDADKTYRATGLLGIQTSTADALGEVIKQVETVQVSLAQLQTVLASFVGPIKQVPSMYSALKHQGTPLYKLARRGVEIERQAREIVINHLELEAFDGRKFTITVSCSKGTYIRNLVEDIGEALGVHAHVTMLHRLSTAGFTADSMHTLDELKMMSQDARLSLLLPIEQAILHFPVLVLSDDEIKALQQGKRVVCPGITERCYRLQDSQQEFWGLVEGDGDGGVKVKRLLSFAP